MPPQHIQFIQHILICEYLEIKTPPKKYDKELCLLYFVELNNEKKIRKTAGHFQDPPHFMTSVDK